MEEEQLREMGRELYGDIVDENTILFNPLPHNNNNLFLHWTCDKSLEYVMKETGFSQEISMMYKFNITMAHTFLDTNEYTRKCYGEETKGQLVMIYDGYLRAYWPHIKKEERTMEKMSIFSFPRWFEGVFKVGKIILKDTTTGSVICIDKTDEWKFPGCVDIRNLVETIKVKKNKKKKGKKGRKGKK